MTNHERSELEVTPEGDIRPVRTTTLPDETAPQTTGGTSPVAVQPGKKTIDDAVDWLLSLTPEEHETLREITEKFEDEEAERIRKEAITNAREFLERKKKEKGKPGEQLSFDFP